MAIGTMCHNLEDAKHYFSEHMVYCCFCCVFCQCLLTLVIPPHYCKWKKCSKETKFGTMLEGYLCLFSWLNLKQMGACGNGFIVKPQWILFHPFLKMKDKSWLISFTTPDFSGRGQYAPLVDGYADLIPWILCQQGNQKCIESWSNSKSFENLIVILVLLTKIELGMRSINFHPSFSEMGEIVLTEVWQWSHSHKPPSVWE